MPRWRSPPTTAMGDAPRARRGLWTPASTRLTGAALDAVLAGGDNAEVLVGGAEPPPNGLQRSRRQADAYVHGFAVAMIVVAAVLLLAAAAAWGLLRPRGVTSG